MTKLPYVGGAATIVKNGIQVMKNTLNSIEPRIVRIDKRLYPRVRDKMNTLKIKAGRVEGKFKTAASRTGVSHNILFAKSHILVFTKYNIDLNTFIRYQCCICIYWVLIVIGKYLMPTCLLSFRMHIHFWIESHQRFVECNNLLFGTLAPVSVKQRVLSLYIVLKFG